MAHYKFVFAAENSALRDRADWERWTSENLGLIPDEVRKYVSS